MSAIMTTSWQLKLVPAVLCTFTTMVVNAATDDGHDGPLRRIFGLGAFTDPGSLLRALVETLNPGSPGSDVAVMRAQMETLPKDLNMEILRFLWPFEEMLPDALRQTAKDKEWVLPSFFKQLNAGKLETFPEKVDFLNYFNVEGKHKHPITVFRVRKHEWRGKYKSRHDDGTHMSMRIILDHNSDGKMKFSAQTRPIIGGDGYARPLIPNGEWTDYPETVQCVLIPGVKNKNDRKKRAYDILRKCAIKDYLLELTNYPLRVLKVYHNTHGVTPEQVGKMEQRYNRANVPVALDVLYDKWLDFNKHCDNEDKSVLEWLCETPLQFE